jgi:DNA-binding NtrC family response regulator
MSEKVLLVDDEEDFLDAVAERMRVRGIEVSVTSSVEDALEMIEGESFDAIVMDLMMPELEGTKALKAIKNKKRELQVILLTGYVTLEKVIQAMRLGAMDIIEKPPDLDVLTQDIEMAHDKKERIIAEKQIEKGLRKKHRAISKGGFKMKPRVFIVDDEEELLQTLSERLTIRDYDVSTSLTGKDAIEEMKQYNFDVVILDVAMPDMDGIKTLREIKRIKPLTEVIMLTGHATVESAIEGMRLGAFDFLMKPCKTEELVAKIDMAHEKKIEHEERIRAAKVSDIISSPRSVLKEP